MSESSWNAIVVALIGALATIISALINQKKEDRDHQKDETSRQSSLKRLALALKANWERVVFLGVIVLILAAVIVALFRPFAPVLALQTSYGRYVTAMNNESDRNWVLRAETKSIGDWEKFTFLCMEDGKVVLRTYHDRYVTAMDNADSRDWILRAETMNIGDWEKFILIDAQAEKQLQCSDVIKPFGQNKIDIVLLTFHDKYVTAMNDQGNWVLRAEATTISDSAKFTVSPP